MAASIWLLFSSTITFDVNATENTLKIALLASSVSKGEQKTVFCKAIERGVWANVLPKEMDIIKTTSGRGKKPFGINLAP